MLPNGDTSLINEAGLRYYDNLIDELLSAGIEPMVTIYHWDMPKRLADLGGMNNTDIVEHFVDFADLVFMRFGDRVPCWITFNEPYMMCNTYEYRNTHPYFSSDFVSTNYLCTYRMLQAHAKIYALYKQKYSHFKGRVGITLNVEYAYPANPNNPDDVEAANRALQFNVCI